MAFAYYSKSVHWFQRYSLFVEFVVFPQNYNIFLHNKCNDYFTQATVIWLLY